MASQEPAEEHGNTETEEGTIAIQKKRARRVSFAENTSVHFFDRDEEFETPPDSTKPSSFSELGKPDEDLGFSGDAAEANDTKDSAQNDEEEEFVEFMDELGSRSPFLRPIGSPSPGSTFGSATSNDEDNFFGPVSSSFIRPSRLLDSGASDENHDLTMDSTAFSMHFRSIARSDSEGELKTSTRLQLSFEEKTPSSDSIPSTRGSSMVLTEVKRPDNHSSVYISKLNDGCDSNDMSLVGEHLHRYDYDRLSPGLDALLAEGSKDLHVVSTSNNSNDLEPSPNRERKLSSPKENEVVPLDLHKHNKETKVTEADSFVENEFNQENVGSISPSHQMAISFSSTTSKVGYLSTSSPHSLKVSPNAKGNGSMNDASPWRSDGSNTLDPDNLSPRSDGFAAQANLYPLPGSTSTLSAKRRRILVNNASPSKSQWNVTPSDKITSSLSRTENTVHDESTSSILKSISKLRMLEASPFSSALNAKIEDSSLRSSDNFFKRTPLGTLLEKNIKFPQVNVAGYNGIESRSQNISSGQPLSAVDQKRRENGRLMNMNDSSLETPKGFKVASLSDLPSQFTWSGEKIQSNLLTLKDPTEGNSIIAGDKAIDSPQRLVLSSIKRLEFFKSPKHHSSSLINQSLPIGAVGDADSRNNVINTNCSMNAAEKTDSLFTGRNEISKPLNIGISTEVDNGAITIVQDGLGTMRDVVNSMRDKESENYRSRSANKDLQTGSVLSRFGNELLDGGIKIASLVSHQIADKSSIQKKLVDQFCQSPLKDMLYSASPNDHVHDLPEEDVQSPGPNLLTKGNVNSSERKRRNEDTNFENGDHIEEFIGIERTPKLQKVGVPLECVNKVNSGLSINGVKKQLAEISTKFLEDTKGLLSSSVDKLNIQAIDMLEDLMCQLQRSKTYEMLCTHIESQKSFDHSSDLLRKREEKTKMLLHKVVHEQAKLQLMRVKRERLQKRIQLARAGIQESELLKSNCLPPKSQHIQVEEDGRKSLTGNIKEIQEAGCDEESSRRLVVEESERRIFELTKAFHLSLKMKREPNPAETIIAVNNHLIKKACFRLVRMESQLWVVDHLESKNGHHSVELNYHDLILQRLTITVNPVSSIRVSNKLNETNIIKNFADMDACTAFRFVFNAETTRKYVGAPNLAQDTQKSSSLLGNLLDVIQEIQLARIELQNLTHTSFCSPSVEQLYLQLCFFDYKHGQKTTVTLDMSCLKRGVYPSEILPCHSVIPINGSQNSPSETLSPEITAAVQNLSVGFTRIIRLSRCISQSIIS